FGFFAAEPEALAFGEYATRWMREHANLHCKPSTIRSYNGILKLYLVPRFESVRLDGINRDAIKAMFVDLSEQGLSRNTLKNVLIVIRTILNGAIEDGIISANPAGKLGKFIPRAGDHFEVSPLTREELERFLAAALEICPEQYSLFLTLARTGMRLGEVLGLRWGDIQFGEDGNDKNRFVYVRRNWVEGQFGKPKSGKERRVDLSRQLRAVLIEQRDRCMLDAYLAGRSSIVDELVFLPKLEPHWTVGTCTLGISFPPSGKPDSDTFGFMICGIPTLPCSFRRAPASPMCGTSLDTARSKSRSTFTAIWLRAQISAGLMAWMR